MRTTSRGFALHEFADSNGNACSLQESCVASNVWLGCNEIGLERFVPYQGWQNVELEQDPHGVHHVANNRMHLSQSQVAALLPLLTYFAEHGQLPLAGEGDA